MIRRAAFLLCAAQFLAHAAHAQSTYRLSSDADLPAPVRSAAGQIFLGESAEIASTIFALEDEHRFVTTGHVVQYILANELGVERGVERDLRSQEINLTLSSVARGSDHRGIFYMETFDASPEVFGGPMRFAWNDGIRLLSDVVVLRSELALPPLRLSRHEPYFGEQLFAIGYPASARDGPEHGLRISVGRRINPSGGLMLRIQALAPSLEMAAWQRMIVTDALCEEGMSGGALVNEFGEVVGVISHIVRTEGDTQSLTCTGLSLVDLEGLRQIWADF